MQPNYDAETGIHYGVIHGHKIDSYILNEDIYQDGEDLDYAEYLIEGEKSIRSAIHEALDEIFSEGADEIADSAVDLWKETAGENYQQPGDNPRVIYKKDGYTLQTCGDGDIFVIKSPHVIYCAPCSPCAPNAGYLETPGRLKCYALGEEFFSDDSPMPYVIPLKEEIEE